MTDKLTAVLLFGVAAFLFSNFPDFHTIGSKLITLVEGALEIEFHQGGRWGVLLVPCSGAKQGPSDPNPPRNSMGERDGGDPPEDELARRLNFATPRSETKERHRHANQKSSSPGEAASVRDPLHGYKNGIYSKKGVKRRRRTFGIGVLAALMVWMLCIACLGVMVWLNCDGCSQLGVKGMSNGSIELMVLKNEECALFSVVGRRCKLVRGRQFLVMSSHIVLSV